MTHEWERPVKSSEAQVSLGVWGPVWPQTPWLGSSPGRGCLLAPVYRTETSLRGSTGPDCRPLAGPASLPQASAPGRSGGGSSSELLARGLGFAWARVRGQDGVVMATRWACHPGVLSRWCCAARGAVKPGRPGPQAQTQE